MIGVKVGWVRRFELPISRATTWRLNRWATPTAHNSILAVSELGGQPFVRFGILDTE